MVEIIKNNKLKFIITGGILLVFIIVLIILNANNNKIKFVNKNIDINDPNVELYKDYDSGNISVDEYVLYSAYMIFEPEKLDEKYKGDGIVVNAQNIMNLVDMYEDKLSDKTINYIYSKMMMENITLGEQDSVSYVEDGITPVSNKIAETANKTNLNKYKISSEGNFVVWYTTEGNDAITDDAANEIASNLEEYVKIYENTYNVEFKWEKAYFGQTTDEDYKNYLDSIAPNDAEKLFDAMPVFISSSSESKEGSIIIAFYSQMEPGKRYLEQGNDVPISNGIKVGPYINIHPEYIMDDSLINYRSSLAHELFHHFQEYICGDGTYKICDTNSAGNQLFIIETSAEWASSKVVSTDIIDTNFIPLLENNDQRLDTLLEYSTQSFLMNYENIVQDGNTKILNSLRSPNGDTLKSLYEQTDNMAEVMKSLSTNILLNNYNSDSFDGVGKYNFDLLKKTDLSENENVNQTIKAMSLNYLFVNSSKNKYKITPGTDNSDIYLSVIVAPSENIKEEEVTIGSKSYNLNGVEGYKVVYSKKFDKEVVLDLNDYSDYLVIFAISNGNFDNDFSYSVEKTNDEATEELSMSNTDDENTNESTDKLTTKVFDIYLDNELTDLNNFSYQNRAFVDINDFCNKTKLCEFEYTDNSMEKVNITSQIEVSGNKFTYSLINEKDNKDFNSTLKIGDVSYKLSQLSVDVASCPSGMDDLGNTIPNCGKNGYYIPIRFMAQALGYNVDWDEGKSNRIDITTDLQSKLIDEYNLRFVLSTDKIELESEVTNIIEINDSDEITLDLNKKYYLYIVDDSNIRKYNSAIALLNGSESNINLTDESGENDTSYSSIELKSSTSGTLSFVSTITVPSDNNNYKSGTYPIIKVVDFK